ncbi:hypothetical protein MMR84_26010, partial [Escherichia coli]|nr:hypothetical protein [Escherichia coli]
MRTRGPVSGSPRSFPVNGPRLPYRGPSAATIFRQPPVVPYPAQVTTVSIVNLMIAGLMFLAVIATFALSGAMLTNWKIHYLTAGGNFYEKLHPATYFTFLAFGFLLIRNSDPVGEIDRIFSDAKLVIFYLLCWCFLLVQMFV